MVFKRALRRTLHHARRILLIAGVLVLPAAVSLLLLRFVLGVDLAGFVPIWNDDVLYWHQIATFRQVGLAGGYYVNNEVPAPAAFTHFDWHGPLFPLLYGSVARLAGWQLYSAPIYNVVVVTLALAFFILAVKPDTLQLAALGLAVLTNWALWIYIPTNHQETLHQAIALVLAAAFYRVLKGRDNLRPAHWIAFTAWLFLAATLRLTWGLLFIPLLVLANRRATLPRTALALAGAGGLIGAAFLAFRQMSAPYPAPHALALHQGLRSSSSLPNPALVLYTVKANLGQFLRGQGVESTLRVQVLALALVLGASAALAALPAARREDAPGDAEKLPPPERLIHLSNLALVLALELALNDITDFRDYRVLAPHFFLSVLLLIACRRFRLGGAVLFSSAALLPLFLSTYTYMTFDGQGFTYPQEDLQAVEAATAGQIVYQSGQDAWCNTVLLPVDNVGPNLVALPPGIGISVYFSPDGLVYPLRSRYLLLSEDNLAELRAQGPLNVEYLADTPIAGLYHNLDANCPP